MYVNANLEPAVPSTSPGQVPTLSGRWSRPWGHRRGSRRTRAIRRESFRRSYARARPSGITLLGGNEKTAPYYQFHDDVIGPFEEARDVLSEGYKGPGYYEVELEDKSPATIYIDTPVTFDGLLGGDLGVEDWEPEEGLGFLKKVVKGVRKVAKKVTKPVAGLVKKVTDIGPLKSIKKIGRKIVAGGAGVMTGGLIKPKLLGVKGGRSQALYRKAGKLTRAVALPSVAITREVAKKAIPIPKPIVVQEEIAPPTPPPSAIVQAPEPGVPPGFMDFYRQQAMQAQQQQQQFDEFARQQELLRQMREQTQAAATMPAPPASFAPPPASWSAGGGGGGGPDIPPPPPEELTPGTPEVAKAGMMGGGAGLAILAVGIGAMLFFGGGKKKGRR